MRRKIPERKEVVGSECVGWLRRTKCNSAQPDCDIRAWVNHDINKESCLLQPYKAGRTGVNLSVPLLFFLYPHFIKPTVHWELLFNFVDLEGVPIQEEAKRQLDL